MSNKKELDEQIEEWVKQVELGENPPTNDMLGVLKRLQIERNRYPWHVHMRQLLGFMLIIGHLYFMYISYETAYKYMIGLYVFPMTALILDYLRLLNKKGGKQ